MPFKSKAQIKAFGAKVKTGEISQKTFNEWMSATPNPHGLPERVKRGRKTKNKSMAYTKSMRPR